MNFKKNAVPSSKAPVFPGYGNGYMTQGPKKSVSLLTLIIVVVVTLTLAFVLFKNYERITHLFASSVESTGLVIGQEVDLSGHIEANGDLIVYTHSLILEDLSVVGLKSRTMDLNLYTGIVQVQGKVEKAYMDMFIVEVSTISGALASTGTAGSLLGSGSGMYIAQAGIYLPAEFGQSYALLNQGENGVLKVQNLTNNQIIQIIYFACKTSDPNKNCSQLQKNIGSSAEKTLSSVRGDTLYKLEGISSWYFSNANHYGYFINDVADEEVITLVNSLILPTKTYIKDTLLSRYQSSLCNDGVSSLSQVSTYDLSMDLNGLVVTLQGPTADGSASCKIFIDPSQAAGGTKISYITNTAAPALSDSVPSSSASLTLDTSVKQFPINLEKSMTFTSSVKGYSLVFPSSNIAYEAVNISDDLGLPGVRCSSQMNVTKFSDKATMNEDPKVKIFTCSIKGTLNNLSNDMMQKTSANGTQFIIQIMDSAWIDFANNIQIN